MNFAIKVQHHLTAEQRAVERLTQRRIGYVSTGTKLPDFLGNQLADPETAAWSLGTFVTVAEFSREGNEAAALADASAQTLTRVMMPFGNISSGLAWRFAMPCS
jgi:hypothetical protein